MPNPMDKYKHPKSVDMDLGENVEGESYDFIRDIMGP